MAHDVRSNPSDRALLEMLSAARSIAIVGATSQVSSVFANAMQILAEAGFSVIPVLRHEARIQAQRADTSITAIPDHTDIILVCDAEAAVVSLVDDAVGVGARTLWLQPGITNPTIVRRAADVGLSVVIGRDLGTTVVEFGIIHRAPTLPYDIVEEAGRESFPASDPPPWSRMRPGGPREPSTEASP